MFSIDFAIIKASDRYLEDTAQDKYCFLLNALRGRASRARARERRGDARAVSIGSNETFRWIRAMRGRGRWRARDEDGDDG